MLIKIKDIISVEEAYSYLQSPVCGAVNLFVGTVRNWNKNKKVTKLVFEAYETMAIKQMENIALMAHQKWNLQNVAMIHAVGEKKPGEIAVITGASSTHREASFEACRFLIDELKKTVPIWKQEWYEDGNVWINAHP